MTAIFIISMAFVCALVIAHAVATAPEGYQDERGFHVGAPDPRRDDSLLENPS